MAAAASSRAAATGLGARGSRSRGLVPGPGSGQRGVGLLGAGQRGLQLPGQVAGLQPGRLGIRPGIGGVLLGGIAAFHAAAADSLGLGGASLGSRGAGLGSPAGGLGCGRGRGDPLGRGVGDLPLHDCPASRQSRRRLTHRPSAARAPGPPAAVPAGTAAPRSELL